MRHPRRWTGGVPSPPPHNRSRFLNAAVEPPKTVNDFENVCALVCPRVPSCAWASRAATATRSSRCSSSATCRARCRSRRTSTSRRRSARPSRTRSSRGCPTRPRSSRSSRRRARSRASARRGTRTTRTWRGRRPHRSCTAPRYAPRALRAGRSGFPRRAQTPRQATRGRRRAVNGTKQKKSRSPDARRPANEPQPNDRATPPPRPRVCRPPAPPQVPAWGNDTAFASMYLAYEALSPALRRMLDGLGAVHTAGVAFSPAPERAERFAGDGPMKYDLDAVVAGGGGVVHPVVRTHPVTGRRGLFVNSMFTTHFDGMTEDESRPLLEVHTVGGHHHPRPASSRDPRPSRVVCVDPVCRAPAEVVAVARARPLRLARTRTRPHAHVGMSAAPSARRDGARRGGRARRKEGRRICAPLRNVTTAQTIEPPRDAAAAADMARVPLRARHQAAVPRARLVGAQPGEVGGPEAARGRKIGARKRHWGAVRHGRACPSRATPTAHPITRGWATRDGSWRRSFTRAPLEHAMCRDGPGSERAFRLSRGALARVWRAGWHRPVHNRPSTPPPPNYSPLHPYRWPSGTTAARSTWRSTTRPARTAASCAASRAWARRRSKDGARFARMDSGKDTRSIAMGCWV